MREAKTMLKAAVSKHKAAHSWTGWGERREEDSLLLCSDGHTRRTEGEDGLTCSTLAFVAVWVINTLGPI